MKKIMKKATEKATEKDFMEKTKKMLGNWRADVLFVMAALALVLLVCEAENARAFFVAKGVGLILVGACWVLAKRWDSQGKIDEINDFCEEQ